ncbi:MAG: hypothetical protein H7296_08920 [Bacteroidia bacterium]|nr:hypothetical protein [Bacteroidia bacterium]
MNAQTVNNQFLEIGNLQINWNSLYKVYVNVELELNNSVFKIEVIDGYLNPGEYLELYHQKMTRNQSQIVIFNIKKGPRTNTFISVEGIKMVNNTDSILVFVKREKEICGYQWSDMKNICLGEPI